MPSTIDASGILLLQQIGSTVQYKSSTGSLWTDISANGWPVTFNNKDVSSNNMLEVQFTTDLSLNSSPQFFAMGSNYITVDGLNHSVYIATISPSYGGLFDNGRPIGRGNSYITIQNLGVKGRGILSNGSGWIGRPYFGKDASANYITNCYSTGTISGSSAGGICGANSQCTVSNCYSTGDISGNITGGIFGSNTQALAYNCYSTGNIDASGGGGIFAGLNSSSANASDCYSTGIITGTRAGGIFGIDSSGSATNCYSTGNITGTQAGGIFPNGATSGGGTASNCYSTGTISGSSAGGIGNASTSKCYSTNGSLKWLDASANASLNVLENVWTDIDLNATNVPYLLSSFTNALYNPNSGTNAIDSSNSLLSDCSFSIVSVNGLNPYDYPGITINSNTGDISFNSLSDGTYEVNVLARNANDGYSIGTFTNTISNICFPAGTPIVTNQGIIAINKINPDIHTIRNKKIVAITKTVSPDKYLVKFEKDALSANLPSEATTMTQNHMLFYKGKMIKAKEFLKTHNESVSKVPYNGQVLYNVLMEEHDKMVVNNLICETLHPENYVAKMYQAFKVLTPKQRVELIKHVNKVVLTEDIYKKPTSKRFTFNVNK
jgi:hypothetical protein